MKTMNFMSRPLPGDITGDIQMEILPERSKRRWNLNHSAQRHVPGNSGSGGFSSCGSVLIRGSHLCSTVSRSAIVGVKTFSHDPLSAGVSGCCLLSNDGGKKRGSKYGRRLDPL